MLPGELMLGWTSAWDALDPELGFTKGHRGLGLGQPVRCSAFVLVSSAVHWG